MLGFFFIIFCWADSVRIHRRMDCTFFGSTTRIGSIASQVQITHSSTPGRANRVEVTRVESQITEPNYFPTLLWKVLRGKGPPSYHLNLPYRMILLGYSVIWGSLLYLRYRARKISINPKSAP